MRPSLRFLYIYCNDLSLMRRFYSDLLQLEEVYHDEKSLAYRCHSLQFTIFQVEDHLQATPGWGRQPGWTGGTQPNTSWSIECDQGNFLPTIARLKAAKTIFFYPKPQWLGYWSYPVKDPAGNTVEITCPSADLDEE